MKSSFLPRAKRDGGNEIESIRSIQAGNVTSATLCVVVPYNKKK